MKINRKHIKRMLDGNWTLSDRGTIEIMQEEINLLQDSLSTCLEILLNKKVISEHDLLKKFKEGWKITYE